ALPVPGGFLFIEIVERQQCGAQRFADRHVGFQLVQQVAHVVEVRVEVAPRQGVLGRVIAKERATRDACGLGDVVDADIVEVPGREQVDGHVGDVIPGRRAPTAHAVLGNRRHWSTLPFRHSMPYYCGLGHTVETQPYERCCSWSRTS